MDDKLKNIDFAIKTAEVVILIGNIVNKSSELIKLINPETKSINS